MFAATGSSGRRGPLWADPSRPHARRAVSGRHQAARRRGTSRGRWSPEQARPAFSDTMHEPMDVAGSCSLPDDPPQQCGQTEDKNTGASDQSE
jgi:hypothetical protein